MPPALGFRETPQALPQRLVSPRRQSLQLGALLSLGIFGVAYAFSISSYPLPLTTGHLATGMVLVAVGLGMLGVVLTNRVFIGAATTLVAVVQAQADHAH